MRSTVRPGWPKPWCRSWWRSGVMTNDAKRTTKPVAGKVEKVRRPHSSSSPESRVGTTFTIDDITQATGGNRARWATYLKKKVTV
jgi:hypothetical protein